MIFTHGCDNTSGKDDSEKKGTSNIEESKETDNSEATHPEDSDTSSQQEASLEILKGIFLDSPVDGVVYVSGGQRGNTDEYGTFYYEEGNRVQFSVGGIVLGEGEAKSTVTPVDLVENATDASNQAVTNIARFLQTLDDDGDPTNGITITPAVVIAIENVAETINFNVPPEIFEADNTVQSVVIAVSKETALTGGKQTLVSSEEATAHLNNSITEIEQNSDNHPPPQNAAVSVSYTDLDPDGGELGGFLSITKASDESDVTHYVLYWGTSSNKKQGAKPISTIVKTGSNLTHTFPDNTTIPSEATHLLVFTKNANGEMGIGVNVAITDLGVPTHSAISMSFTDTDFEGGKLAGNVAVTKASDENDVTHYVLYWGSSSSSKQSLTPITTIEKTGSNLTYTFPNNTTIPSEATHLLVFTKNADGEMGTGINVAITDLGVPINAAVSVIFNDTDLDGGQLAGDITIIKASDESDVTHYVLYWGTSSTAKQSTSEITSLAVTGSNVTHPFSLDTSIPSGATHLLVFTKNTDGEMGTGINVAITDLGVPTSAASSVAFTDTDLDGSQLAGDVTMTKASDENDVTHYVLYWGSSSSSKQSLTPITTIEKTGSNLTYTFPNNTTIPSEATHLLVFTKNADGEMSSGVNVVIIEAVSPCTDLSVTFTDTDINVRRLSGEVRIFKASDESDITHYVLYWGINSTTKQSSTAISSIAKTGGNLSYSFDANTPIPSGVTHLLVFTENDEGENRICANAPIVDVGIYGYHIPDTGQTIGYTQTFGEDHDYLYNELSYIDNSDGTITDKITGLMWQQGENSFREPWSYASESYCANLTLASYSDWRLPTKKELMRIINYGMYEPAIDTIFFPTSVSSAVWSSTVDSNDSNNVFAVSLGYGYVFSGSKTSEMYIKCVRKPSNLTFSYNDNGDGTITDNFSELMWQKEDDNTKKNGESSLSYCENLSLGGETDWRLPNIKELESITDDSKYNPVINTTYFINTKSDKYCSSTTRANNIRLYSWHVNFSNGEVHDHWKSNNECYVRCVRGSGESNVSFPVHTANSVAFLDTDTDVGELGGRVTIKKASDESNITHYVLYWGSDTTTKANSIPISTLSATGNNQTFDFDNTSIPSGSTHLLVFTKNTRGEMARGVNVIIFDNGRHGYYIPDTGQTISYTSTLGEDHDYLLNEPSYTDNDDGTITDNITGLIWQKEDDNTKRTWSEAQDYCNSLNLASFSDWQLPSKKTLMRIVNYRTYNSSINEAYFSKTKSSDYYWTASNYIAFSNTAWVIDFGSGVVYSSHMSLNNYVRCVRNGVSEFTLFTDNSDGTVTDNLSGLMWQKENDYYTKISWGESLSYCENLSLGGKTDWRLPNIKELESITNDSEFNPAIESTYFPNTYSSKYWSSTTFIFTAGMTQSWFVDFYYGFVERSEKTDTNHVKCVRGGHNGVVVDVGVPSHNATSVVFVDTDTDAGELGGSVTITKARYESDITHYVLYWGSSATTKVNSTPITTLAASGSNLSFDFDTNTSIPSGSTHLLVFTKNNNGEGPWVSEAIHDFTGHIPKAEQELSDASENRMSYTDNKDGTVTDNVTGLVWQKTNATNTPTMSDAVTYCENLELSFYSDWRVPSKKELIRIIIYNKELRYDESYFNFLDTGNYWSNTSYANNQDLAWDVSFRDGSVGSRSWGFKHGVRCVRGYSNTDSSFLDNGDGTITDNFSELMWQKEDDNTLKNRGNALSYCENLSQGGKTDWRLPNIKELESITDDLNYNPAINTSFFPNTKSSYYWSKTNYYDYDPISKNTVEIVWFVNFQNGEVKSENNISMYVRCVR
ncbi:DUF1566 domain-containing protein [Deltaproteobacteria bacterium TL4]